MIRSRGNNLAVWPATEQRSWSTNGQGWRPLPRLGLPTALNQALLDTIRVGQRIRAICLHHLAGDDGAASYRLWGWQEGLST